MVVKESTVVYTVVSCNYSMSVVRVGVKIVSTIFFEVIKYVYKIKSFFWFFLI